MNPSESVSTTDTSTPTFPLRPQCFICGMPDGRATVGIVRDGHFVCTRCEHVAGIVIALRSQVRDLKCQLRDHGIKPLRTEVRP